MVCRIFLYGEFTSDDSREYIIFNNRWWMIILSWTVSFTRDAYHFWWVCKKKNFNNFILCWTFWYNPSIDSFILTFSSYNQYYGKDVAVGCIVNNSLAFSSCVHLTGLCWGFGRSVTKVTVIVFHHIPLAVITNKLRTSCVHIYIQVYIPTYNSLERIKRSRASKGW